MNYKVKQVMGSSPPIWWVEDERGVWKASFEFENSAALFASLLNQPTRDEDLQSKYDEVARLSHEWRNRAEALQTEVERLRVDTENHDWLVSDRNKYKAAYENAYASLGTAKTQLAASRKLCLARTAELAELKSPRNPWANATAFMSDLAEARRQLDEARQHSGRLANHLDAARALCARQAIW